DGEVDRVPELRAEFDHASDARRVHALRTVADQRLKVHRPRSCRRRPAGAGRTTPANNSRAGVVRSIPAWRGARLAQSRSADLALAVAGLLETEHRLGLRVKTLGVLEALDALRPGQDVR